MKARKGKKGNGGQAQAQGKAQSNASVNGTNGGAAPKQTSNGEEDKTEAATNGSASKDDGDQNGTTTPSHTQQSGSAATEHIGLVIHDDDD